MNAKECPNRRQLEAYAAGRLSDEDSAALDDHIDDCPSCQAELMTLDDVKDTLLVRLRCATGEDEYQQEPEYHKALLLAEALLNNPAIAANEPANRLSIDNDNLGQLGEYQLLQRLGQGGMGTVYKARQMKLKKIVALKVLPKERMQDQRAVARFEREMEAVGAVDHPNIVRAMDAREIDGTHFLVMEHVEGMDLNELVKRCGPLGIADTCELIRQAALGLQCAHENGLVHRDIKPPNLMLTGHGQVKILDLGLALLGTDQPAGQEMTGTNIAMGTADYMAPEQAIDSHNVDIRADIYALGCTLFKLLTGQAPFSDPRHKSNLEKLMAHMKEPAPSIQLLRVDVPDALAVVVERMLAKEPAERFATPGEVAEVIEPFAATADLARLSADAKSIAKGASQVEQFSVATEPLVSSAMIGTQPTVSLASCVASEPVSPVPLQPPVVRPLLSRVVRYWKPVAVPVAVGMLFVFVLLGIVIHIKDKSGRETIITLPEGSEVTIEREKPVGQAPPDKTAAKQDRQGQPDLQAPTAVALATVALADKENPFVLMRAGGQREEFKYAAEALALLKAGDAVEVHGNGPFRVPAVRLNKGLTLRAAPGYRPRFVLTKPDKGNWGSVDVRGPLKVEGCDFFSFVSLEMMFSGGGGPCEFRDCRCFYRARWGDFLIWKDAPSVCVRDCLILNVGIATDAKKVELLNNIFFLGGEPAHQVLSFGLGQTVRLIQNTIIAGVCAEDSVLTQGTNVTPAGSLPTTVEAVGNIFYSSQLVHSYFPPEKQKDVLAWRGRNNLYVGPTKFLSYQHAPTRVENLAGWKQLWGGEEGSRHIERVAFQAAVLVHGTPEAAMAWLQERVAAVRRQLGPKLKDFGPQWDLIGPGEAYVRALAADGHPVPLDQLRPEAPEDGPFVLLRQGEAIRGYPSLQQAVDAVQNGDTVEIRTNGPVPGCSRSPSPTPITMTLRAAPGYRPVISSRIFVEDGILLSVEGLDFRNASLLVNSYAKAAGGIVRLANCSFSGMEKTKQCVGAVFQSAAEDGRPEVHNCSIPCQLEVPGKVSKVAICNSILGTFCGGDEAHLELRQSILGVPGIVDEPRPRSFLSSAKAVTAQGTLFDAVTDLQSYAKPSHWHGAGNVYAMPILWPSVEQLRSKWKSPEEGSLEADPAIFDPRAWRLLSTSPGFHEGPDGKDLGADTSRIGVTSPAGQAPPPPAAKEPSFQASPPKPAP